MPYIGPERRKRGRPPLVEGESSANVHVTMPVSLYDRLYVAASGDRISVPERIRRAVERDLKTQNSETALQR